MNLEAAKIASPVGDLHVVSSDCGLVALLWGDEFDRECRVRFASEIQVARMPGGFGAIAAQQLDEYFAGQRQEFAIPLDLRGTEFQVRAWRALAGIPFGQMSTYKRQAQQIGSPNAVRAVGAANGRNPVSIILPCHRVVGSDGSLTGFAGGLATKRALLEFELRVSMGDGTPMSPVAAG